MVYKGEEGQRLYVVFVAQSLDKKKFKNLKNKLYSD